MTQTTKAQVETERQVQVQALTARQVQAQMDRQVQEGRVWLRQTNRRKAASGSVRDRFRLRQRDRLSPGWDKDNVRLKSRQREKFRLSQRLVQVKAQMKRQVETCLSCFNPVIPQIYLLRYFICYFKHIDLISNCCSNICTAVTLKLNKVTTNEKQESGWAEHRLRHVMLGRPSV